jgi:hypothetical protein
VGLRELVYAFALGLAGLVLATVVLLAPWYPGPERPSAPVVELVVPGGVAGQR